VQGLAGDPAAVLLELLAEDGDVLVHLLLFGHEQLAVLGVVGGRLRHEAALVADVLRVAHDLAVAHGDLPLALPVGLGEALVLVHVLVRRFEVLEVGLLEPVLQLPEGVVETHPQRVHGVVSLVGQLPLQGVVLLRRLTALALLVRRHHVRQLPQLGRVGPLRAADGVRLDPELVFDLRQRRFEALLELEEPHVVQLEQPVHVGKVPPHRRQPLLLGVLELQEVLAQQRVLARRQLRVRRRQRRRVLPQPLRRGRPHDPAPPRPNLGRRLARGRKLLGRQLPHRRQPRRRLALLRLPLGQSPPPLLVPAPALGGAVADPALDGLAHDHGCGGGLLGRWGEPEQAPGRRL